jgi:hypothetical protein
MPGFFPKNITRIIKSYLPGYPIQLKTYLLFGLLLFFLFLIVAFFYDRANKTSEGFNETNAKYTYYPKKVDKIQDVSIQFFINDFMKDAIEVPECIKTYKELIPPPDSSNTSLPPNEYFTRAITDTDIYKKYKTDITEETKAKSIMDEKYGMLFKKETYILPNTKSQVVELKDFKKTVESVLLFENKLHNFINFSTIRAFDTQFSFTEFSDYFATILHKYHNKPAQLEEIQTFMYKLLTPLYLYSKFIDHFVSNQSVYTQKDDILYVLNTAKELLKNVKIEEFSHSSTNKNVYIFKDDTANVDDKTLSIDSLTLFSMMHILLQLRKVLQPNVSKYTQISDQELSTTLQIYLDKKFPDEKDGNDPESSKKRISAISFGLMSENAPTLVDG